MRTETYQFFAAILLGSLLGASKPPLGGAVLLILAASFVLTIITILLDSRRLPPELRSPYGPLGFTVPRERFSLLFFGTIATMGIVTVI